MYPVLSGLSNELLLQQVLKQATPVAHAEWQAMQVDRATLVDEWRRMGLDLAAQLSPHLVKPSARLGIRRKLDIPRLGTWRKQNY